MLDDLGEVELGCVPAADSIVGSKVALAVKMVSCRSVPLKFKIFFGFIGGGETGSKYVQS